MRELRKNISEVCGSEFWKPITTKLFSDKEIFQIFKFENDIEFEGETYRCIIIEKTIWDDEDHEAIIYTEDIYFEAWKI